ncbi:hypothetical protein [Ornithobacterium rhinotracheale]|nr:hypothetical protein [Ornithobacterium rhinotracheale]MBN3661748.1 hypothetical protein [Ornithobacterium rhinotracheale]MCK0204646.1 hypothetical protein [Ornithobacterium rhinotracheale]UOH63644.1 hypothetical protein MT993_00075 [Ornithobacterium rhinotracheale]CAI9429340.1 DUF600 domain-containing protein [Candidatus Ornithobacterium hominis]
MRQKEIFNSLVIGLIDDIPQGEQFEKAELNIMRLEGVVEFNSYIIDGENKKRTLEVSMGYKYAKLIHELYNITQNEPPVHTNWNRAKFTLFHDGKMQMEYIWDQELQDEVDGYNNDIKPNA